jgi:hypothetical protein
VVDNAAGGRENATSVDGIQKHALGTFQIAKMLTLLAEEQTDPALKSYYEALAEKAYYLGATEAELEDVAELRVTSSQSGYSNATALRDLYNYKKEFEALMNNPVPGLDPTELQAVKPLLSEVNQIGNRYLDNLSSFINAQGQVSGNFWIKDASGNLISQPGSIFADGVKFTARSSKPVSATYASLVPYDQLKRNVDTLLNKHQIVVEPVKTTFTDAQQVNTHAPE